MRGQNYGFAVLFGLAFLVQQAHAEEEAVSNVYAAGPDVRIEAPVDGDLFAAAGRISVERPVRGDAVLAGGSVEIRNTIGDDLRAVGGVVTLAGRIAGEALIAGGSIAFGQDTEVAGRTWLAGGDIAVAGRLLGGLKVYGKNVLLLGEVHGPVEISADHIEVLASARIAGDITYTSEHKIKIDPSAAISGRVTRSPGVFEFPRPKFNLGWLPPFRPLLLLGLLAAGALLLSIFPGFTAHSQQTVAASPLKSLGLGTAIFFSLPPVILLLVLTIIGIPIALALAAFYAVALLTGYLVAAFFIGDRLMRPLNRPPEPNFGWRMGALAAALILLWFVYYIPYLGSVIVLAALLVGLGAMVLQAFSRYAQRG